MLIGICGPSNSGKSSLCEVLESNNNASWIEVDHYLKDLNEVPMIGKYRNWELPEIHRFDALFEDIQKLLHGESINHPIYDFKRGRIKGHRELKPSEMILVEGFYVFSDERIRNLFDVKIYLNLPEAELLKRRVCTEEEWDWSKRDYVEKVVIPMYRKYGATQKSYSDFVIDATLPKEKVLAQTLSIIN